MSNPPGAKVYLDGQEIGQTPFSTPFNYYGEREFRVVKQGYETKTELLSVRAPWYQWIGLDFVSEVLLPGKLTDHKYFEFDLQPAKIVPDSEAAVRAEEFRQIAHADGIPRISNSAATLSPSTSGSIASPPIHLAPAIPSERHPISEQPAANLPSTNPYVPPFIPQRDH